MHRQAVRDSHLLCAGGDDDDDVDEQNDDDEVGDEEVVAVIISPLMRMKRTLHCVHGLAGRH